MPLDQVQRLILLMKRSQIRKLLVNHVLFQRLQRWQRREDVLPLLRRLPPLVRL